MTNDNEPQSWLATAPTWLHLLLAILATGGSVALFMLQNEKRIAVLEERQAQVIQHQREQATLSESFRRELLLKIDSLSTQITVLTIEYAKHEARYNVINGGGGTGLRAPVKQQ